MKNTMKDRNARLDKLGDFLEKNEITIQDLLATILGGLTAREEKEFKTQLGVAGYVWYIEFKKGKKI